MKRICISLGANKKARRRKKVRKHRSRYASAGLMMQMDGSEHSWVKGKIWVPIAGIDDATSEVPYGEFFPTEGLLGYLAVLRKVIQTRGVPRVSMLSGVLNSDRAVQVNILIMRAFVQLRQTSEAHLDLVKRFDQLESRCNDEGWYSSRSGPEY